MCIRDSYRVVEEKQLDNIEESIKNKLELLSKEHNLLDAYAFWNIYHIWNYIDRESMNNYLKESLKTASNVPKYLSIVAISWNGSNDSGWSFKEENFSDGITLETAYEQIVNLKCTIEFSELKFEVKEMAIAFYLWYNTDRKDKTKVSKQTVDELIPQWEKQSN